MIELESVLIKGFMPFVEEYRIPLARQGLVFVVGENKVSKMADSNGSGKTALFDAISWAAYDRILRGTGGDRVINRHSKYAHVELGFRIDDDRFSVVRQQGQKRIWELFDDNGKTLGSGEDVARLFGLSYRAFIQTILYGVSNLDSFAQQSDVPRKQLFDDLLDTAFFGEKKKAIEIESKQVVEKLELAQRELAEVMASLQTLETEQVAIGAKREEAESQALIHWLDAHEDRLKLYDDVNETMQKYLLAMMSVEREQALVDDSLALAALRNRLSNMQKQTDRRMLRLESDLKRIVSAERCEMCRRPFDAETRKDVVKYFDQEFAPLQTEWEQFEFYIISLDMALASWPKISADDNADLLRHKLERLHAQLEQHRPSQLEEARFLRQASDEIDERREALLQKQTKLQGIVDEYQAAMTLREFWIEGFGHRGIKAMLLADYEVFINERLRRYSQTLTAGELTLTFKASKTLKSGTVRDEIQFTAVNVNGAEVYDDLSSGEKQRVDLCLVLALQDLVRELHRGRFGLALYDEIFEHFDETGCEQVMDFLTTQRREFGSVFVISQNPKLLSYPADHIIRVVKTQKGSSIHAS